MLARPTLGLRSSRNARTALLPQRSGCAPPATLGLGSSRHARAALLRHGGAVIALDANGADGGASVVAEGAARSGERV
ncbi:MAG: hypothetical protein M3350_02125, partial [Actinomycetota bacterium]|nr:hypothetical protein [Actinomycetota bacterium]